MISSEEIAQLKGVNESEASWQRRKKFLMVFESKFLKERLNTLSYCYVNVLRYGCRYSDKLMDELYEMACEVANFPWEDPVNMTKWHEIFDEAVVKPVNRGRKKKKKDEKMFSKSLIVQKENVRMESDEKKEVIVKTSSKLNLKKPAHFELTDSHNIPQEVVPKLMDEITEPVSSKPNVGNQEKGVEKIKKRLVVKSRSFIKKKTVGKYVKKKLVKNHVPNKESKTMVSRNFVCNTVVSELNQNEQTSCTNPSPYKSEINTKIDEKVNHIKAGKLNSRAENPLQQKISPVSSKMQTAKINSEQASQRDSSKISSEKFTLKPLNKQPTNIKPENVRNSTELTGKHDFDKRSRSKEIKRVSYSTDSCKKLDTSGIKDLKYSSGNNQNLNASEKCNPKDNKRSSSISPRKMFKNDKVKAEQKFYVSNKRLDNHESLKTHSLTQPNSNNDSNSKKNGNRNSVSPDTGSVVVSKAKSTTLSNEDVKISGCKSPFLPSGGNGASKNTPSQDVNNNAIPGAYKSKDEKMKSKDRENKSAEVFHGKKHHEDGKSFHRRLFDSSSPTFGERYLSGYNTNYHRNSPGDTINRPHPRSNLNYAPWYGQDYTFPFYDQYLEYTRNYAPYHSVGKYRSGYAVMESFSNTTNLTGPKKSPTTNVSDGKSGNLQKKTATDRNFRSSKGYYTKTVRNTNVQCKGTGNVQKSEVQENKDTPIKRKARPSDLLHGRKDSSDDIWLQSVLDQIRKS